MMATVVIALIARYLNRRAAFRVPAGLSVWFIYALLGYFGRYQKHGDASSWNRLPRRSRPSSASAQAAVAFPIWIILCTQCLRIGVELFLHQLWMDGHRLRQRRPWKEESNSLSITYKMPKEIF